jgi:hypothetical protein
VPRTSHAGNGSLTIGYSAIQFARWPRAGRPCDSAAAVHGQSSAWPGDASSVVGGEEHDDTSSSAGIHGSASRSAGCEAADRPRGRRLRPRPRSGSMCSVRTSSPERLSSPECRRARVVERVSESRRAERFCAPLVSVGLGSGGGVPAQLVLLALSPNALEADVLAA